MIASVLANGLWEGAILLAMGYIVTLIAARHGASTRHAIWFATLVALLIVPLLTSMNFGAHIALAVGAPSPAAVRITLIPISAFRAAAGGWLAAAAPWALAVWIAGVAVCLLRLVTSFVRIERIRKEAIAREDLGALVFVSDAVAVPIVAGILSPIIVLPATLETELSATDIQRIVRHERAHMRRWDPLLNLVARSIEALLFFNPWVRVAGRQLCIEREIACDDWVVEETGNPADYATCLATLARTVRRERSPLLTPSAFGSRTSLVTRIRRLHSDRPRRLTISAFTVGGIIMLFAVLTIALGLISPALAIPSVSASDAQSSPVLVAANCAVPNIEAVVTNPAMPMLPHGLQVSGSANVSVTIAPNGHVTHTSIVKSSGNAAIDAAIVKAARTSTYAPKLVNCVPVQGEYLFQVKFKPNP